MLIAKRAALLCLLSFPALAQPVQTPSPLEQALSQRVIVELNGSLACSAKLIELEAKLKAAEAELAKLKPKEKLP